MERSNMFSGFPMVFSWFSNQRSSHVTKGPFDQPPDLPEGIDGRLEVCGHIDVQGRQLLKHLRFDGHSDAVRL